MKTLPQLHDLRPELENFSASCENFPLARAYQKTGICSRQDAKNAKSGSLISLRPLRLCARYSEFWLRLRRALRRE
jgi:hypothetical protein